MDEVEPGPARDVAGPDALAASERTARRYRTRLAIALVSSSIFLLVEAGAGRLTNSLTLLSGDGHLLADVVAMGMGLAAFGLADRQRRLRRTDRRAGTRTFTPYQVQMVAALLGSLATIGIAVFAIILAFGRRSGDAEVLGLPMLVVAAIGLLVNLASFVLLREGERVSLRLGGSWLEVLADTTDTLGVTAAALLVELFNWAWADALIGFALAIWLLPRSFRLARQSLRILRRAAPSDLDLDEVRSALSRIDGVSEVRELRVWTLSSELDAASVHLVVDRADSRQPVSEVAKQLFQGHCDITHGTVHLSVHGHSERSEVVW